MHYLTATHERPPRHITTAAGSIIPTQVLIDRDDETALNTAGLYKHVTVEGPAPLGYTNWTMVDGQYVREPAGTQAERDAALLKSRWRRSRSAKDRRNALANLDTPIDEPVVEARFKAIQTLTGV